MPKGRVIINNRSHARDNNKVRIFTGMVCKPINANAK